MKIGLSFLTLINVSQLIYMGAGEFPGKRTQNNVNDSYLDMHTGGMDMTESTSLGLSCPGAQAATREEGNQTSQGL